MKIIRFVFISCIGLAVLALVVWYAISMIQQLANHPPEVNNLPAYPGAKQVADTTTHGFGFTNRTITGQTTDSAADVIAYYSSVLAQDTWIRGSVNGAVLVPPDRLRFHWWSEQTSMYVLDVRAREQDGMTTIELTLHNGY